MGKADGRLRVSRDLLWSSSIQTLLEWGQDVISRGECIFSLYPGGHLPTLQNWYRATYWLILYPLQRGQILRSHGYRIPIELSHDHQQGLLSRYVMTPSSGAIVTHTVQFTSVNIGHTTLDSKDTIKSIEKWRDNVLRSNFNASLKILTLFLCPLMFLPPNHPWL